MEIALVESEISPHSKAASERPGKWLAKLPSRASPPMRNQTKLGSSRVGVLSSVFLD